jgi:hypothetical protein
MNVHKNSTHTPKLEGNGKKSLDEDNSLLSIIFSSLGFAKPKDNEGHYPSSLISESLCINNVNMMLLDSILITNRKFL